MLNLRLNADIVEWYMRYLYMCEEVPFDMTLDIIKDYSEKEIDENNNLVLNFRGITEEEEVFKSLIKKLVIDVSKSFLKSDNNGIEVVIVLLFVLISSSSSMHIKYDGETLNKFESICIELLFMFFTSPFSYFLIADF